ncbi:MAG: creatininase family protein [Candidatus Bathyarchaeota archaeon]|nr:MAG: creatininase family protein [Candidatus Bathyarchaeota archaeon]
MKKYLLQENSWVEAKKYFAENDVVLLPVGSTEQHGPQNPLGTDHLIARALAEETAKQTGTLCLPVVPFGVSSHHKQFWGTISVKPEVLREYVRHICLSLKYYGVKKVVIVNGHGGNASALLEVAREFRERGMFVSIFQWWPASREFLPNIFSSEERGHAAAEETSVNLAIHPHLVDMEKALDEKPRKPPAETAGIIGWIFDTIDYTSSGVFGKASTASIERGKKVFETAIKELVKHVKTVKELEIEDLLSKHPV